MSAGWHVIEVRYFEQEGNEMLEVRYKGPDTGGNKKVIPDNVPFR